MPQKWGKKVPPLGLYMGDQKLHKHSIVRKEWMHFPLIIRVCSHGTEMLRIVHSEESAAFLQVNPQRQIHCKWCGSAPVDFGADYANVSRKKINVFKMCIVSTAKSTTINFHCGVVMDFNFPIEVKGEDLQQIRSISATEIDMLQFLCIAFSS